MTMNNKKDLKIDIEGMVLEVRNKYRFLNIDEHTFNLITRKACLQAKKTFKGDSIDDLKKTLTTSLTDMITEYIKIEIQTSDSVSMVDGFINYTFNLSQDKHKIVEEFENLEYFLSSIDCTLTDDLWIELLDKNKKLRDALNVLVVEEELPQSNFLNQFLILYKILNTDIDRDNFFQNDYQSTKGEGKFTTDLITEYLKSIDKKVLSSEETKILFRRLEDGDQTAKRIIIERNLKLVVAFAKRYMNSGLPFLDLVQEGNLGLMKAVEHFDVNKGYAFSTYASYWINRFMKRALSVQVRNIKVSIYMDIKLRKFLKEEYLYMIELGREPSVSELAKKFNISIEEVLEFQRLQYDTLSLNLPISAEDETNEIGDFIIDDSSSADEEVVQSDMKMQVRNLLKKCNLTPREQEIICMRYGIDGNDFQTLESLKNKFSVSRARIGQIEQTALEKIRKSKCINSLAVYLDNPEQALQFVKKYQKKK